MTGFEYKKFNNKYFVRINKGEEIISTLKEFCKVNNINLGTVQGIGAINKATFGFFNPETKEYEEKTFSQPMEITSLLGNITVKNKEPYLHLHMNAAGKDYNTVGGHLVNAVVSLTAEITVKQSIGDIGRKFDDNIGLNLWDIE